MSKYVNTGGLWINKGKDGEDYLAGSFDSEGKVIKIKVFKNTFKKEGDRTPDYKIMLDDSVATSKPDNRPKDREKYVVPARKEADFDESDIPY